MDVARRSQSPQVAKPVIGHRGGPTHLITKRGRVVRIVQICIRDQRTLTRRIRGSGLSSPHIKVLRIAQNDIALRIFGLHQRAAATGGVGVVGISASVAISIDV